MCHFGRHAHKSTVMDLKWNRNGNWLCSASRDHLLKLFDIRNLSTEFQVGGAIAVSVCVYVYVYEIVLYTYPSVCI